MMPPKKDTQKTEKGASLEQSTHGQAELVTIDQKGKKDNVDGNGQASGQDQVGSTTEEEGPSLTDMGIIDANDASVEADNTDSFSTIPTKNGQNEDGTSAEHSQVELVYKNESGTDESVEGEEQPKRQGKPVDSTGQTPLTSTNNDNEKTPNTSVQTNTSNSITDSLTDYIPSQMTKDKRVEGKEIKGKEALEPVTRPGGGKKGNARGGGGQNTGHDVTRNINKQPPHSVDSSENGNTDNALPQSSVPESKEKVPYGAQSKDEKTYCTLFKTVWGLRLDLLLLTIGVVIAAVILRLPLGAQVALENPAIQTKLRDLEDQFNRQFNEVINKMKDLKSEVEAINDTVSEVIKNSRTAEKKVDQTNENLEIVHEHLLNKGALTAVILILFFLIIGLMLYVLKLKSSLEPSLGGSTSRPLKGSREMEVVLHKMSSRPTLENAVCIVSFDASNSDEYKRMIKETYGQLGGVSFRTHVIRKHADIAELPHCRLYIMCVEFTERHVIIEEQGLGLGDLKLTSYRGVRKLGGALVILYIHDPGSRNLTDDQLYSDGVYCVKKQQELKELCEIDRFISAHNKLNTAQKKALETAISRVLNIQATRH